MNEITAIGGLVAFTSAASAFLVPSSTRPQVAARVVTLLMFVSATAVVWTLVLIAAANVVQLHGIAERLSWCADVVSRHRGTLTPIGGVTSLALALIGWRAFRVRRRHVSLVADVGSASTLAVVDSAIPTAFALPGRPGRVVVSTAMLRALAPKDRRVLLAHERAHLRCRHHRFVRVSRFAAAAMPLLAPCQRRVRVATERWADEEAAAEIGDRVAVAGAVARAALVQAGTPGPGLGIADSGVAQRVEALLNGPVPRRPSLEVGLGALAVVAAVALAVLVVEPLVAVSLRFC